MGENKILNGVMINRFFDGFTKYERTICSLLGFLLYQLIFWQARKKLHSPSKSSTSHKLSSTHVDSPIFLPFPPLRQTYVPLLLRTPVSGSVLNSQCTGLRFLSLPIFKISLLLFSNTLTEGSFLLRRREPVVNSNHTNITNE